MSLLDRMPISEQDQSGLQYEKLRSGGLEIVGLIEAGPMDHRWDYRLHMPAALSQVLSSRWYNWHYEAGIVQPKRLTADTI